MVKTQIALSEKNGKEAFEQEIQDAEPLSTYLFKNLTSQVQVGSNEGKAALEALAKPLIEKIPDDHLQAQLFKMLGEKTGHFLEHQVSSKRAAKQNHSAPQKNSQNPPNAGSHSFACTKSEL